MCFPRLETSSFSRCVSRWAVLLSMRVFSSCCTYHVQGDVEGIAAMSPRSLTALFEDISGYVGLCKWGWNAARGSNAAFGMQVGGAKAGL